MLNRIAIVDQSDIIGKGLSSILNEIPATEIRHFKSNNGLSDFLNHPGDQTILLISNTLINEVAFSKYISHHNNLLILQMRSDSENIFKSSSSCIHIDQNKEEIIELVEGYINCTDQTTPSKSESELTQREEDVLKLVAFGHSNKEIADKLHISFHTVISHRKNLTEKLGIKSISGLTVYAILNRLIDPDTIDVEKLI